MLSYLLSTNYDDSQANFVWDTGDTTATIIVSSIGYYNVTVEGCLALTGGVFDDSEHREFIVDTNSTCSTIVRKSFERWK